VCVFHLHADGGVVKCEFVDSQLQRVEILRVQGVNAVLWCAHVVDGVWGVGVKRFGCCCDVLFVRISPDRPTRIHTQSRKSHPSIATPPSTHAPGVEHGAGLLKSWEGVGHGCGVFGLVVEDRVPDLRLSRGAHARDDVANLFWLFVCVCVCVCVCTCLLVFVGGGLCFGGFERMDQNLNNCMGVCVGGGFSCPV
jgi:hypothetical protein